MRQRIRRVLVCAVLLLCGAVSAGASEIPASGQARPEAALPEENSVPSGAEPPGEHSVRPERLVSGYMDVPALAALPYPEECLPEDERQNANLPMAFPAYLFRRCEWAMFERQVLARADFRNFPSSFDGAPGFGYLEARALALTYLSPVFSHQLELSRGLRFDRVDSMSASRYASLAFMLNVNARLTALLAVRERQTEQDLREWQNGGDAAKALFRRHSRSFRDPALEARLDDRMTRTRFHEHLAMLRLGKGLVALSSLRAETVMDRDGPPRSSAYEGGPDPFRPYVDKQALMRLERELSALRALCREHRDDPLMWELGAVVDAVGLPVSMFRIFVEELETVRRLGLYPYAAWDIHLYTADVLRDLREHNSRKLSRYLLGMETLVLSPQLHDKVTPKRTRAMDAALEKACKRLRACYWPMQVLLGKTIESLERHIYY